jgi:nucleotide-binding universal stress UspA family protein
VKKARTKHQRAGKRRELAPLEEIDAQDGPKMQALPTDRHRAFVRALYEVRPGHGAGVKAAKASGWGCENSTPQSMATIASRLAHDERVLEAIREEDEKRIRASAPRAIRALSHLIETPSHKDHARGIGMVLDRVHPSETRHQVDVHHHVVDHTAEAIAQLRMLKGLDVPRSRLEEVFGFSGLARYERLLEIAEAKNSPKLIEGTAIENRKEAS